jgi:tetratricopeptide (TPR) repeat protein
MGYLGSWLSTVGMLAAVALVQNVTWAKTAGNENQIAPAITVTDVPLIVQNPTLTADDYLNSASEKNKNGDYRGALIDYNRAISLDPNAANAYNNRGLLKDEKLNDPQGALIDYDQADFLTGTLCERFKAILSKCLP